MLVHPQDRNPHTPCDGLTVRHREHQVLLLPIDPDLLQRFGWNPRIFAPCIHQRARDGDRSIAIGMILQFATNVERAHLIVKYSQPRIQRK